MSSGNFKIKCGDDAIHSEGNVTIQNGIFTIAYCYEGIEDLMITVDDGTFDITSVDDGINSAGGTDSSDFGGRRPGREQLSSSFNRSITINGESSKLTCNGNRNTALDCDGIYTHNDGDITTNDGSKDNPGQMGGSGGPSGQNRMGHRRTNSN